MVAFRQRSVRARLAGLAVGAALAPTLLVLLVAGAVLRAQVRAELARIAREDLAAREERLHDALAEFAADCRALAVACGAPPAGAATAADSAALLEALAREARTDLQRFAEDHYRRFLRVAALAADGSAAAAVQAEYETGGGIRARALQGAELAAAGLRPDDWARIPPGGSWIAPAAATGQVGFVRCVARLADGAGPLAAIALDARTQQLLGAGGRASAVRGLGFAFDAAGTILSHPDPTARGQPLAVHDPELAAAVDGARDGLAWLARDGRRQLLAVKVLSETPGAWRLARLADVEGLLAALQQALLIGLLAAVLAAGAGALAAWRLSLDFARAVEDLAAGTRRLGAGDYAARVESRRSDELGALAAGFNRMAEQLGTALEAVAERARLEARDRARVELLANVSHDLRTPLTAIRWSVENLLDGVVGPLEPRQVEYLSGIRDGAGHLLLLIEELLRSGRSDAASLPGPSGLSLQLESLELRDVAEEAAALLGALAERRGVTLVVRGAAATRGDRERLRQVLVNLLDNAIKFSPTGAAIEVELAQDADGSARAAVIDRGPGVAEARRAAIFERFCSGGGGAGIGLHLARGLVRQHGGELAVDDRPAGGARFFFVLPPRGTGQEAAAAAAEAESCRRETS